MEKIILALLITIIVESIVLFLFLHKKKSSYLILFAGLLVNMITNPALNLLFNDSNLLLFECGIVIIETILYSALLDLDHRKGFLISLCANAVSFSMGFFLPL